MLSTAARWCDDLNAQRVLIERQRDAHLEACGLTSQDIVNRYAVGATRPGGEGGNVWAFVDGSTARRGSNGRWEVVSDG